MLWYICLFSICVLNIILLSNNFCVNAADEKVRYVLSDIDNNLTNLVNGDQNLDTKYDFINLASASYYLIDGNSFNATLWIKSFNALTSINTLNGSIIYGILIDSDPYTNTGINGVDYDLQLELNSSKKSATKELKEISVDGDTKTITFNEENYTDIVQKEKKYINLNLDLDDIQSPSAFDVLFYAMFDPLNKESNDSCNHDSCKLLDYLKWINIPPPTVNLSTNTDSMNLRQDSGEVLTIYATSKSTSNIEIIFYFYSPPKYLTIKFNDPHSNSMCSKFNYNLPNSTCLFLPKKETNFVEVTISASREADPGKLNLKLSSEISIPDEEITYFSTLYGNNTGINNKENALNVSSKVSKLPFTPVEVIIEEYDYLQTILDKYNKYLQTLSAIGVAIVGILSYFKRPWITEKFKNLKTKRKIKKSSNDQ